MKNPKIVVINAGTSVPSTTSKLAELIANKTVQLLPGATTATINLGEISGELGQAIVSAMPAERLANAIHILAEADGIIAATPIYKAGLSGLFKTFIDVLDNDLIIAAPTVLAATAGTARHALVVEEHMRPLFAFMRAITTPTSVFAAPEDWGDTALGKRIDRAATELAALVMSRVRETIANQAWDFYDHAFDSNAATIRNLSESANPLAANDQPHSGVSASSNGVNIDTDLMRLAAGGKKYRGRQDE